MENLFLISLSVFRAEKKNMLREMGGAQGIGITISWVRSLVLADIDMLHSIALDVNTHNVDTQLDTGYIMKTFHLW